MKLRVFFVVLAVVSMVGLNGCAQTNDPAEKIHQVETSLAATMRLDDNKGQVIKLVLDQGGIHEAKKVIK